MAGSIQMTTSPILQAIIYLAAMVLTVPLAKRFGLGAVLGYLIAGALLGPSALSLLGGEQAEVLHLAEFGVIMMLFIIGLELKPSLLWKLKGPIFGLGGIQVVVTTCALALICFGLDTDARVALAIGMILCLSSTAIVLQTLQEKGALKTTGGEIAFAVLLFQDMAVIPMLAILPLLAVNSSAATGESPWLQFGKILGAVILVVVTGRYLVRPVFRMVVTSQLREIFTAVALLIVLGITALMNSVGLSPSLGAFLAGVVLAESEYRHQLETDIEPFKGLLLGVFFISIGAGIDFSLLRTSPALILWGVLGLILVKGVILYVIGRMGRLSLPDRLLLTVSLAQGGEFAFVLVGFARGNSLFSAELAGQLTAIAALSMFAAPLLIGAYFKFIQPRFAAEKDPSREADVIDENENPVIIAGFGRFGQMVARLLRASGFRPTVLDYDAEQIEVLRKFGLKAFYGDASRMDLLRSAGAAQAKLLIVAIDDRDKTLEIVESARKEFPGLEILARAYDRIHAYELIHRGIRAPYIETAGSALSLATEGLRILGFPAREALKAAQLFKRHNDRSIQELARVYHESDETTYVAQVKTWISALENTLRGDATTLKAEVDRAWESAPRGAPTPPTPVKD